MLHHTPGRLRIATLALSIIITTLSGITSLATPAAAISLNGSAAVAAGQEILVIKPSRVAWSDPELVNPMRGLYRWLNNENVPSPNPLPRRTTDAYERYTWSDIEKGRGEYDFSVLEADIAKAAAAGQKFAFRIRALVNNKGRAVPGYIESALDLGWWTDMNDDGKSDTYVPDWNDPIFIDGVQRLLNALGERYDNDPRISYIDIGIYGSWGEWHTSGISYNSTRPAKAMTRENRQRVIDFHIAAFPNTPLVMMTDDEQSLVYALERSPRIGWRRDSLGVEHFEGVVGDVRRLGEDKLALFLERWKTAPVVTEFMNPKYHDDSDTYKLALEQVKRYHISMVGNGNMVPWGEMSTSGRDSLVQMAKLSGYRFAPIEIAVPTVFKTNEQVLVQSRWINEGVAPSYEQWEVWYQLRDGAGAVVWEARSKLDLRRLLPNDAASALTVADELTLPNGLRPASYSLSLVVRDPRGARDPMALAIKDQRGDGSYALGTVAVEVGRTLNVALENRVFLPLVQR
jgi:hypothetical protein